MHGEKAIALLREAKRNPKDLNPYDDEAIQATIEEIKALYHEVECTQQENEKEELSTPYIAGNILVHFNSAKRNKRVILALLLHRLRLIQEMRWDLGTTVLPKPVRENLHRLEIEFFNSYQNLLANYMKSIDGLDLTMSDQPPKELKIQVRVLKDFGSVTTLEGKITLQKGTTHFLKRSDVETLIRQGIVEHIV